MSVCKCGQKSLIHCQVMHSDMEQFVIVTTKKYLTENVLRRSKQATKRSIVVVVFGAWTYRGRMLDPSIPLPPRPSLSHIWVPAEGRHLTISVSSKGRRLDLYVSIKPKHNRTIRRYSWAQNKAPTITLQVVLRKAAKLWC